MSDRYSWQPPGWSRRQPTTPSPRETNAKVVLVVDDDETVCRSVAKILRTVGYTVIPAADGEDALRLLTTMRFDVMVLDLKMPHLSGLGLLTLLPEPPPVVLVSAYELDAESNARFGKAIVAQLRKPVPPQQLLDAVASAAGRRVHSGE